MDEITPHDAPPLAESVVSLLSSSTQRIRAAAAETRTSFSSICSSPNGVAHLANAIAAMGFTVQVVLLPFVLLRIGAPVTDNGTILGVYAAAQCIGSLIGGRLTDKRGSLPLMIASLLGVTAGSIGMAISTTPQQLIVLALLGCANQGYLAAAHAVASHASPSYRMSALAHLSLSYGIGLIAGCMICAAGTQYLGIRTTLLIAAVLTAVPLLWLSHVTSRLGVQDAATTPAPPRPFLQRIFAEVKKNRDILLKTGSLCVVLFLGIFPTLLARFAFPPIAVTLYGLDPQQNSLLIGYAGVLMILSEGIIAPWALTVFPKTTVATTSAFGACILFPLLAIVTPMPRAVFVLLSSVYIMGGIMYLFALSEMLARVEPEEFGTAIGFHYFLYEVLCGIAPVVGLFLFEEYGLVALWFVSSLCATFLALLNGMFKVLDTDDVEDEVGVQAKTQ